MLQNQFWHSKTFHRKQLAFWSFLNIFLELATVCKFALCSTSVSAFQKKGFNSSLNPAATAFGFSQFYSVPQNLFAKYFSRKILRIFMPHFISRNFSSFYLVTSVCIVTKYLRYTLYLKISSMEMTAFPQCLCHHQTQVGKQTSISILCFSKSLPTQKLVKWRWSSVWGARV